MGGVPAKKYRIKLTSDERSALEEVRNRGSHKSQKFKRIQALLLCDEGLEGPAMRDPDVTPLIGMSPSSLERLRKRCCEVGPLGALEPKQRETPPREIKITSDVEAHITRLACSTPPEGQTRWTLSLIADKLIEIEVVDSIGRTSISMVLKKANLNLGSKKDGVFRLKKTPPS